MNKKNVGKRIGTFVTAILCIIAAVAFWIFAKYILKINGESAVMLFNLISEGLI